jgi:hypothetical protein
VKRPSFSELAEQLGTMLDDSIRRVSCTGDSFLSQESLRKCVLSFVITLYSCYYQYGVGSVQTVKHHKFIGKLFETL